MTKKTMNRTPHPWSLVRSGVSRSWSEGPGRMAFGTSGAAGTRRARPRVSRALPATTRKIAPPTARISPWAFDSASITTSSRRHAERSLGRLVDRVRPPGRPQDDLGRVDHDLAPGHGHLESIEPSGSRPQLVLARAVVLGAVARALEPLRLLAERDPA